MASYSKCGFDVKTDDATHTSKGCERFITYTVRLSGATSAGIPR
jgi:hypothetical protein